MHQHLFCFYFLGLVNIICHHLFALPLLLCASLWLSSPFLSPFSSLLLPHFSFILSPTSVSPDTHHPLPFFSSGLLCRNADRESTGVHHLDDGRRGEFFWDLWPQVNSLQNNNENSLFHHKYPSDPWQRSLSVNEEIPWKCKSELRDPLSVCVYVCVCLFPRLNDPTQCPANGSRREDCDCRRDYTAAGVTTFSKVRLDISKMNIISKWPVHMQTADDTHKHTRAIASCASANSTLLPNKNFLCHLIMSVLMRVNGIKMSLRFI